MVFSELPVGADFYFGRVTKTQYNYGTTRAGQTTTYEAPIIWRKTALNGLSVCVKEGGYASFDHRREATGTNRYMRTHGHRLFYLASIYKYLNCMDSSYLTVPDGDVAMRNNSYESGFLSRFNEEELKFLEPYSMKIPVPSGYNKQYGAEMEKKVLVGLPSEQELGTRNANGTFGIRLDRAETWLREADTMSRFLDYGSVYRTGGDVSKRIMPVIRIKDDAPVDVDEQMHYVIRVPESEFEGDIAMFLGLEFEAAA